MDNITSSRYVKTFGCLVTQSQKSGVSGQIKLYHPSSCCAQNSCCCCHMEVVKLKSISFTRGLSPQSQNNSFDEHAFSQAIVISWVFSVLFFATHKVEGPSFLSSQKASSQLEYRELQSLSMSNSCLSIGMLYEGVMALHDAMSLPVGSYCEQKFTPSYTPQPPSESCLVWSAQYCGNPKSASMKRGVSSSAPSSLTTCSEKSSHFPNDTDALLCSPDARGSKENVFTTMISSSLP